MNLPGFFFWSNAWLLLLVPPLVLLYFLKLRRPRVEIPSLVLWRQVLNDSRVNSPFQRFRKNILLLLQLTLLCLLILAAMMPYWQSAAERAQYLPILIDASASMAATDPATGKSRLALAKDNVQQIIDGLLPDQQLCLIAFDQTARRLTGFTNNKRQLSDALRDLTIAEVPSNIEDALRLTAALARTVAFDNAVMLSDGVFPQHSDFDLSFKLDYRQIDPAGPNVGVTGLNARRDGPDQWRVFVNLEASTSDPLTTSVEFLLDDEVQVSDVVTLRGRPEPLEWPVSIDKPTRLTVRLRPQGFDALASDNVASMDLHPPRRLRVFVPADMASHRLALGVQEGVRLMPDADDENLAGVEFDVVISRDEKDRDRVAQVYFFDGVIPADAAELLAVSQRGDSVIDWQRTAALLEHVRLNAIEMLDRVELRGDNARTALEQLGYETLADGRFGPVVLRKREAGRQYFYLLFNTDQSWLPSMIGFPILMQNLTRVGLTQAGLAEVNAQRTGVLPPLMLTSEQTYELRSPRGARQTFNADARGRLAGVVAPYVGRYELRAAGNLAAALDANLLDSRETRLQPVEKILFTDMTVTAAQEPLQTDRSFWWWIAAAALGMLVLEWWFFQKKPSRI